MTEKIRDLTNKAHLAGALAEFTDLKEGTTQDGVPYIAFAGVLQCGETSDYSVRFRTFVKSKKKDNTDSKLYAKVKDWVKSATPMTKDKENPTYVDMVGSLTDNPYVASDGQLRETVQFNMQLFNDFKEYCADIDLEGFVHSIKDETKGGEDAEPTGRQKIRLITRDIFGNTLDIKNIVVPEEFVTPLEENGYERGVTAKFFISLMPNKVKTPAKAGGIGVQRTDGRTYLEWIMTGAEPVIDSSSDKALDPKVIKAAMVERQSKLDEIKEAGYQGNSESKSSTSSGSRNGLASTSQKTNNKPSTDYDDIDVDDDIPF